MRVFFVPAMLCFFAFPVTLGLAAETEAPGECPDHVSGLVRVPFTRFVRLLAATRNIHTLVDRLEATYHGKNFVVAMPFQKERIFILQEEDRVAKFLRSKKSKLPYVNKNFDISHGHFFSINSVDVGTPLWQDLHRHLAQIFNGRDIAPIMEKHKSILVGEDTYVLNEKLEEFFLKVWAEYCFGPTDPTLFKKVRGQLIETLGLVFHRNAWNRLPIIGRFTSRWNYRRHKAELEEIDEGLTALLNNAINVNKEGVFYELYERLKPRYGNAFQIALDNSFLGILVYDFLYGVYLDAMVNLAKDPSKLPQKQLEESVHTAFLYPFRFRMAGERTDEIAAGDFVVVNLHKAGLYFSTGPRSCPGYGIFEKAAKKLFEIYGGYDIRLENPDEKITYNGNRDIPIMTSRHKIHLTPRQPTEAP